MFFITAAHAEFTEYRSIFIDRFDFPYQSGNIASMTATIENMIDAVGFLSPTPIAAQACGSAHTFNSFAKNLLIHRLNAAESLLARRTLPILAATPVDRRFSPWNGL